MADPDYTWLEGFERWGSLGSDNGVWGHTLYQDDGEYTSISYTSGNLVDGLVPSAGGLALQGSSGSSAGATKVMGSNFARVIGGCHMQNLLGAGDVGNFIGFSDGATNQIGIGWNTSGQLLVQRNGTTVATSVETFPTGSINVLEWDITFHNTTGIAKVWLNGVATTINFAGDTCGTANNYCNAFNWLCNRLNKMDHLYLWFFTAAGGAETPALTNAVIETTQLDSVIASDFTLGLGLSVTDELLGGIGGGSANRTGRLSMFRTFIAPATGDVTKLFAYPFSTSAVIACKAALYADDGTGRPGARLCAPVTVTGWTAAIVITFNIATTAIVQGTKYHIGFAFDAASGSSHFGQVESAANGWQTADGSYAAALPVTAIAATVIAPPWIWADITNITAAHEWTQLAFNHPDSAYAYLTSGTINHRDEFGFADLSVNPTTVYSVSVTYAVGKSDAGAKTLDLEVDSGGVKYTGSTLQNGTNKTPPASMTFYTTQYPKNPNGNVTWTKAALDAMHAGYKIVA